MDIVVDTNVLMHAENPASEQQHHAVLLLRHIDQSNTLLCLDESQRILGEYFEQLSNKSVAKGFLKKWLSSNQYVAVKLDLNPADRRWIGNNIGDALDRIFLKATCVSSNRDLVSHDFEDFSLRMRARIQKRLRVSIQTAQQYMT